ARSTADHPARPSRLNLQPGLPAPSSRSSWLCISLPLSVPCGRRLKRRYVRVPGLGLLAGGTGIVLAPLLLEVALDEVVEERTDYGYRPEASNCLPARCDRAFENVGRKLKGKRCDQPARVARPDRSRLVVSKCLDRGANKVDRHLNRCHRDDEQCNRIE